MVCIGLHWPFGKWQPAPKALRRRPDERNYDGKELAEKWKIDARQTRYRKSGNWFHLLKQFPGALCDASGYIVFSTTQDYGECEFYREAKDSTCHGGYRVFLATSMSTVEAWERGSLSDLEKIIAAVGCRAPSHQIGNRSLDADDIKALQDG
jgi:hypothetical protein